MRRRAPGSGRPAAPRECGLDDLAMHVDLVEIVAPKALVGQLADGLDQEPVGEGQRALRGRGPAAGLQRPVVLPPQLRHVDALDLGQVVRTMDGRGALRRRQRRVRTAGGQVRFGESDERIDLERDLVRIAQQPDAFLVERRCGHRIAFPQRELAVDHRSIGGVMLRAGRLPAVDRFDEIRAGGHGVTERMFGVSQHPQRGGQPEAHRSGTAVRISSLQEQPARAPVEPKIAVLVAQVVGDDPLSFGIPRGLEGGQRLLQQAHALRDVRLVERQHVDRVAHAVQIAGAPRERQRPVGGAVALLDAALATAGGRDTPPCPSFPGRMPRCLEHAGGPCAVPGRQRVGVGPELGFAEAHQCDRFQ